MKHATGMSICLLVLGLLCAPVQYAAAQAPGALETITAEDGSVWERVNQPGFGSIDNIAITALCPFQGALYALTRNEVSGFELWRAKAGTWENLSIAGLTDGIFHDRMNSGYGAMIEYNGHLYVAVSSGYEGAFLYRSMGFEIWRFDGTVWAPVVSRMRDALETGSITGLSGCDADDGDPSATLKSAAKTWTVDQWKDGLLRITSGAGKGRIFKILANSADTLTIQQNEAAAPKNADGKITESTVCAAITPDEDHPELALGAVSVGDGFEIGVGPHQNGFGQLWNKNFFDFVIFNGELYASMGHNYQDGTRIWKTGDGLTWNPTSDYSFGLLHGYDPQGNPTDECLVKGYEDKIGMPVCSSTTTFGKSAVSGSETLYIGATGSSGCNGRGARVLKLDKDGTWRFIVDNFVAGGSTGTNSNGFGEAGSFIDSNFQAWSFVNYDNLLLSGVARLKGGRILATATGGAEDGDWQYLMGGDAERPDGIDGVATFMGYGTNILPLLYPFGSGLYAGTFANSSSPALFSRNAYDGADIWRATGTAHDLVWSRITGNGFGDPSIMVFSAFTTFEGSLYAAASNLFGQFPSNLLSGAQGAKLYRLKEATVAAKVSHLGAWAGKTDASINWTTDNESGCSGFNIYRGSSSQPGASFTKLNTDGVIKARGSVTAGASYAFKDTRLAPKKTYYYKVECVGGNGKNSIYGPLPVTTKRLLEKDQTPDSYPPLPEALDALKADADVDVQKITVPEWRNQYYYLFTPKNAQPKKGFIMYPGAKVEPEAYAPMLRDMARQGYLCALVQMPLNMASFGYERATLIMKSAANVTTWTLGGHSFGGSFACNYVKNFPGAIAGVVLYASYPSSMFSIADSAVKVVSIYGTRDGLVTSDKVQNSAADLPAAAQFAPIVGGNHTQFGWYDTTPFPVQPRDNPAAIGRQEQQQAIVEATVRFLGEL